MIQVQGWSTRAENSRGKIPFVCGVLIFSRLLLNTVMRDEVVACDNMHDNLTFRKVGTK